MSAQTDRLRAKLLSIPKAVKDAINPTLIKEGALLVAAIQQLTPVRTGKLQASITATPPGHSTPQYSVPGGSKVAGPNEVLVTAGNELVRYAHIVEHGSVKMHAEPFFWPGYRMMQAKIAKDIKQALAKAAKDRWND